jgi:hypothetical protein
MCASSDLSRTGLAHLPLWRPVCKLRQLAGAVSCEAHELHLVRCQLGSTPWPFDLRAQVLLHRESREVPEEVADASYPLKDTAEGRGNIPEHWPTSAQPAS